MTEPMTCARSGCKRPATRMLTIGEVVNAPVCDDHELVVRAHFIKTLTVTSVPIGPRDDGTGV